MVCLSWEHQEKVLLHGLSELGTSRNGITVWSKRLLKTYHCMVWDKDHQENTLLHGLSWDHQENTLLHGLSELEPSRKYSTVWAGTIKEIHYCMVSGTIKTHHCMVWKRDHKGHTLPHGLSELGPPRKHTTAWFQGLLKTLDCMVWERDHKENTLLHGLKD